MKRRWVWAMCGVALAIAAGCGGARKAKLGAAETFTWVAQPVAFSPPPAKWYRQGSNGGGLLGVYFILTGGGGQCMGVYAYRQLAERDRTEKIRRFIVRRDSLVRREFLDELSLLRPTQEEPVCTREAAAAAQINSAIDRAMSDYLDDHPGFVSGDLDAALRAASGYTPTLADLLPWIKWRPERIVAPQRYRTLYERDTTLADLPAYAVDDSLFTDDRPLLYREIFWVVNGCAFKAVYQGMPENLGTWEQVVDSIRFPQGTSVAAN